MRNALFTAPCQHLVLATPGVGMPAQAFLVSPVLEVSHSTRKHSSCRHARFQFREQPPCCLFVLLQTSTKAKTRIKSQRSGKDKTAPWGLSHSPDAGRRSRENERAGQQGCRHAQEGYEMSNREDHARCARVLHHLRTSLALKKTHKMHPGQD